MPSAVWLLEQRDAHRAGFRGRGRLGQGPLTCQEMAGCFGLDLVPAKIEALRSKAKRLTARGWLAEPAPGGSRSRRPSHGQATGHERGHRPVDHRLRAADGPFEVPHEAAASHQEEPSLARLITILFDVPAVGACPRHNGSSRKTAAYETRCTSQMGGIRAAGRGSGRRSPVCHPLTRWRLSYAGHTGSRADRRTPAGPRRRCRPHHRRALRVRPGAHTRLC